MINNKFAVKNLSFLFLLFTLLLSCSDSSDDKVKEDGISNNPLSGELYDSNFTIGGGKGALANVFGVDSFELYFTSQNLGCETLGFSDFPITLITPRQIGVFTNDVYLTFNDPNSSDFISLSSGITVEILSITDNLVIGKVKGASSSTDNFIEGKFEIPICQ